MREDVIDRAVSSSEHLIDQVRDLVVHDLRQLLAMDGIGAEERVLRFMACGILCAAATRLAGFPTAPAESSVLMGVLGRQIDPTGAFDIARKAH